MEDFIDITADYYYNEEESESQEAVKYIIGDKVMVGKVRT